MGMVVRTNNMAINANRQLGINQTKVQRSLEKLSSGFKINRAGDDAAGLAISEKMKAQIKGLDQAAANSQDGISLVQTAEGALTEVHDMLNRMVELATKSANGTIQNEVDREAIQSEVDALAQEISRIGDATNFNGINLLDGSLGAGSSAVSSITSTAYSKGGVSAAFEASFGNERKTAVSGQKAEFVVSLDDLEFTKGTSANAVNTFKLNVGGTEITLTSKDTAYTAGQLATALAAKGYSLKTDGTLGVTAGGGTSISVGGNIYKMTVSGNSIKFTQAATSAAGAAPINPDFAVSFTATPGTDGGSIAGKINPQVQITKQGLAPGSTEQARVDLEVDFSKLSDGDKMTVGDKTYVFKVGADGAATASGAEVMVDLSALDLTSVAGQKEAMVLITDKMGANGKWSAGNKGVNAGVGTLTFQSISTAIDAGTYKTTTEEEVMAQFSSNTPKKAATTSFEIDATKIGVGDVININGRNYEFTNGANASSDKNIAVDLSALGIEDGLSASDNSAVLNALQTAIGAGPDAAKMDVSINGNKITLTSKNWNNPDDLTGTVDESKTAISVKSGSGLTLQIGDTNDSFNKVTVAVDDMRAAGLGIEGLDVSNQDAAGNAIKTIKNAINKVSTNRSNLGALQNRLEHTINNLNVTSENMTAANSAIRDTDMAKEMMEYTKMNVLTQAAQAMLAQANQQPQAILQLLQ